MTKDNLPKGRGEVTQSIDRETESDGKRDVLFRVRVIRERGGSTGWEMSGVAVGDAT